ncbi:MAG: MBL fold metallo-hydrolase [Syntrophales bacterium]|nr:MBL fold metallo-hydrolase [Syntrophales bacterium]
MKVTILGSGTCVPSLRRNSCSVLVEIGEAKLLFDMGAGTMRRLLEAGVTIGQISHLFFSHLHPDHTGELASFLFASKYPNERRRRSRLRITAAEGFMAFYERLEKVYGQWIELEEGIVDIFEMKSSGPDFMQFDFSNIDTLPMEHTESSIGYRLTMPDNTSIVYTGDTDYCKNAVRLAMKADLLICECSLPDEMKVPGHLTPSLAGRIASEAQVKNLVLTHFYPECDGVDIEAQCRKRYDGGLLCAEDLMRIEIVNGCLSLLE